MTYGEIYKKFKEKYPDVQVSDYRPASCYIEKFNEFFCPKQDGIIIWTKDGDTLIFYPESLGVRNLERISSVFPQLCSHKFILL